ncbi:MAG: peptidase [bacterium]|nr:peptidase [bacterium]
MPIDQLIDPRSPRRPTGPGERLGSSREGRPVFGHRFGHGPRAISLIAGCHADEPVGPAMLDRLAAHLERLPPDAALLSAATWYLVPHTNPDGEARNGSWAEPALAEGGVDLAGYLGHAVREPPGEDVEFGFPRHEQDAEARPENHAVANFLRPGAPFTLHASFHGMAFAAGPWFLIEGSWADRTAEMRRYLRQRVREIGYRPHDIDRRGEKGFHRIDEGFTTRPDSRAMAAHFEALGEPATAALFRPSSMEYVRSLGGDPLTLVSEMPLFLLGAEHFRGGDVVMPRVVRSLAAERRPDRIQALATEHDLRPMPIADQMRLQLEYLQAGLKIVLRRPPGDPQLR